MPAATTDIRLKCKCGAFEGVLENFQVERSGRAYCYCDDCQAYAHSLGRARDLLNKWGGTDITPAMPKQFKVLKGETQLKLLRLTKDGLHRWYVDCCNSPVANAASPSIPYIGLLTSITDLTTDERNQQLGRVRFGTMAKYATGNPPAPKSEGIGFAAMTWTMGDLSRAFFKGGGKPNPFFNEDGKAPKPARVLSHEEREHLRQFCGPKPTTKTY